MAIFFVKNKTKPKTNKKPSMVSKSLVLTKALGNNYVRVEYSSYEWLLIQLLWINSFGDPLPCTSGFSSGWEEGSFTTLKLQWYKWTWCSYGADTPFFCLPSLSSSLTSAISYKLLPYVSVLSPVLLICSLSKPTFIRFNVIEEIDIWYVLIWMICTH